MAQEKEKEKLCPDDKKHKAAVVCEHRHYKAGEGWKPCIHYKAGCSHPAKLKKEEK
jgi:hypothetical protein